MTETASGKCGRQRNGCRADGQSRQAGQEEREGAEEVRDGSTEQEDIQGSRAVGQSGGKSADCGSGFLSAAPYCMGDRFLGYRVPLCQFPVYGNQAYGSHVAFFHVPGYCGRKFPHKASPGGYPDGHEPVYRAVCRRAGPDGLFFLYQEAEHARGNRLPG